MWTTKELGALWRERGSDYEAMLAERSLARVVPTDGRSLAALAALASWKGTKAVPEIVGMAEKAVGSGPIRSDHIVAAITHAYPTEAMQILVDVLRMKA